jgi:hypothetical protein
MKKPFVAYLLLLLSFTLCYCQKPGQVSDKKSANSISQGVCGTVIWKEGNLMPSPDRPASKGKGVVRDVVVYELTNMSQVVSEGGFHRSIKTKLIKKVSSDADGHFCIPLPEGKYSLFVWEDGKGLYANSFDEKNNIFPVTVQRGHIENITFTVDYKAAY